MSIFPTVVLHRCMYCGSLTERRTWSGDVVCPRKACIEDHHKERNP